MSDDLFIEYKHHSASTINKFISDRAGWFMKVFKGSKFSGNIFTARGTAVEHGVNCWLGGMNVQESVTEANKKFVLESAGMDVLPEFRETIGKCVNELIAYLSDKYRDCINEFIQQEKISLAKDDLSRPIIGYLDWLIPKKIVLDCKCVSKTPSSLKQDYQVQGAIYKEATGLPVSFIFVVPLKTGIKIVELPLTEEDYKNGIALAIGAAQAMERIVDSCVDLNVIKDLCFPNPDSMFNKEEIYSVMKEWGMGRNVEEDFEF